MLYFFLKIVIIFICILIIVAYITLVERKILGVLQRRKGPNVVGVYGMLQPLVDGIKLLLKESIMPASSALNLFLVAPIITFSLSLITWALLTLSYKNVIADLNLGLLLIMAISSLSVYGIILSGWSSNSKYAFIGAVRSASQFISYELSMGFIILTITFYTNSFNITEINVFQSDLIFAILLLPLYLIFIVCGLAETNRHPFDLPEAEAELVSGYNVEYSAMEFAMFSLGEYTNIIAMCTLISTLFFGFYFCNFLLLICLHLALFVIARAGLPRYRYDQLMRIGWKVFLPITLSWLICEYVYIYVILKS